MKVKERHGIDCEAKVQVDNHLISQSSAHTTIFLRLDYLILIGIVSFDCMVYPCPLLIRGGNIFVGPLDLDSRSLQSISPQDMLEVISSVDKILLALFRLCIAYSLAHFDVDVA